MWFAWNTKPSRTSSEWKWFDFSTSAIGRRSLAGETGMKDALETLSHLQPGQGL